MARDIQPLTSKDIPELSRFLTTGFNAPPDADYAAPDVLRWKYLNHVVAGETLVPEVGDSKPSDPPADCHTSTSAPRSFIARDETGRIIGHVGLCRTAFEGQAISAYGGQVPTIHIVDWLGSPDHRSVGMSLMRTAHQGVETQFGLGVSQAALAVGERAGYELHGLVPVYMRVLRASYWLRAAGLSPMARVLRLVRNISVQLMYPLATPQVLITLKRVLSFGPEINPVVAHAKAYTILTTRDPERLNMILRFPRQAMTGWHLLDETGRLCGFAVLNVIPKDHERTRTGKILDCLLDNVDVPAWQAAILALTRELARQGADMVQAYASTPWSDEALKQSGYRSRFFVKFHIRDRQALIPRDATFHLTPLEGDYAYT
jgi:hypothetical protein